MQPNFNTRMMHTRTYSSRYFKGVLVALCCLLTLPLWGRGGVYSGHSKGILDGDNYHFGYVSALVGYSMLDSHSAGLMSVGACGGGIGVGYEFRNSGLWTNLGLQLSFHRSSLNLDPYTIDYEGLDTQGKAATLHYRINQKDNIEWNFLDVPILVGYYTHGFHVGAGLKLSYALSPKTHSVGTYNLSATNHDLSVTFSNMPEHGYTDYPFNSQQDNRLNIGVGLIGEIGYDLLSSMPSMSRLCHVLKLSFYFEYGLNNIAKEWETPQSAIVPEQRDATKAQVYPYLNTLSTAQRIVPFFAGAKITYMIGGSRTARSGFHHGCMCYQ